MKILIKLMQVTLIIFFSIHADAKKLLVDIDLNWKPTTDLFDFKKLSYGQLNPYKIKIEPLKDSRVVSPRGRIGENIEDKKEFLPVETKSDVAEFATKHLAEILKKVSINITEDTAADYSLGGELREFFVQEKDTYESIVKINFVLKRKGAVVWTGEKFGKNTRFGRSYKEDNYMESLSDSLIDICLILLSDADFKKAFQTK